MRVKGIPTRVQVGSAEWNERITSKALGTDTARAELVLTRQADGREDFGWDNTHLDRDRTCLKRILAEVSAYLGEPPYEVIPRPKTIRKVPGVARSVDKTK